MILVTGATGTVGSHLLLELLKTEHKIVAITRNIASIEKTKKIFSFYSNDYQALFEHIIWRKADISNYFDVLEAFNGINKVYHCAAYVSFKNNNKDLFFQTNVTGTKNIVNASLNKNIDKLCHVSSIATVAFNPEGLTSEKNYINPDQATTNYALTKYYAELEIWRGIKEGLNAVIVNPSVIVAPYLLNKKSTKIINYLFKKGIKYHTCGKKGYISIYDLVEIMQKLMNSNISNDRFLVSSENLSFKTLIFYVNNILNKNISSKKLSVYTLNFLKLINSIISFGKPLVNKTLIHYAINDELYTSEKIISTINVNFEPIKETLKKIIKIYKNNHPTKDCISND